MEDWKRLWLPWNSLSVKDETDVFDVVNIGTHPRVDCVDEVRVGLAVSLADTTIDACDDETFTSGTVGTARCLLYASEFIREIYYLLCCYAVMLFFFFTSVKNYIFNNFLFFFFIYFLFFDGFIFLDSGFAGPFLTLVFFASDAFSDVSDGSIDVLDAAPILFNGVDGDAICFKG